MKNLTVTVACLMWGCACWAAEPFNYFVTDWNVVGLKDYKKGTRITPFTRLIMAGDADETYHEPNATVQLIAERQRNFLSIKGIPINKTHLCFEQLPFPQKS